MPLRVPTLVLELSNVDRPKPGKIFLFPFLLLLFLHFLSKKRFPLFPLFLSFSFLFSFLSFFSFLISFPFHFSSFSLLLFVIFSPFLEKALIRSKEAISSSFPLHICVANNFHFYFSYFLNPFYDIIHHMCKTREIPISSKRAKS